jgi:hypothetical protein
MEEIGAVSLSKQKDGGVFQLLSDTAAPWGRSIHGR